MLKKKYKSNCHFIYYQVTDISIKILA